MAGLVTSIRLFAGLLIRRSAELLSKPGRCAGAVRSLPEEWWHRRRVDCSTAAVRATRSLLLDSQDRPGCSLLRNDFGSQGWVGSFRSAELSEIPIS
jgi:hypothetical protein